MLGRDRSVPNGSDARSTSHWRLEFSSTDTETAFGREFGLDRGQDPMPALRQTPPAFDADDLPPPVTG